MEGDAKCGKEVLQMHRDCATCHKHTHTHTIVLRLFWILSRTTRVIRYQKGKTNLDLLEQEIVSGSGICWAMCKSAPHPRQITTPTSHHSGFLQARCPFCCRTISVKALKANMNKKAHWMVRWHDMRFTVKNCPQFFWLLLIFYQN